MPTVQLLSGSYGSTHANSPTHSATSTRHNFNQNGCTKATTVPIASFEFDKKSEFDKKGLDRVGPRKSAGKMHNKNEMDHTKETHFNGNDQGDEDDEDDEDDDDDDDDNNDDDNKDEKVEQQLSVTMDNISTALKRWQAQLDVFEQFVAANEVPSFEKPEDLTSEQLRQLHRLGSEAYKTKARQFCAENKSAAKATVDKTLLCLDTMQRRDLRRRKELMSKTRMINTLNSKVMKRPS